MPRIIRLVAFALALIAPLPSLLATAGACGDAAPAVATHDATPHDGHRAPERDPSGASMPEHCAMVSACVSGCAGERVTVALRADPPRNDARLELDARVPDAPLTSPEPPPPRG